MKKQIQDTGLYPFRLFSRMANARIKNRKLIGTRYCGIEDLNTGRTWEWSEGELPGLRVYLRELLANWHPYANKGFKFPPKRQKGAFGVLRKAIEGVFDKHGADLKPAQVWKILKSKPPRGFTFYDKFVDHPDGSTDRKIFGNLVATAKNLRRSNS